MTYDISLSIMDRPLLSGITDSSDSETRGFCKHWWTYSAQWLLIIASLVILTAPLAGKLLGWPPEIDLKEFRKLENPPSFHQTPLNQLPKAIDKWWNDRFGFRTQLIPLQEKLWLGILNAPGKKYIQGKDGHLFLNLVLDEGYHTDQSATILDYMGIYQLAPEKLSKWQNYLEGKNAWLDAWGIQYLFVVAPNKTAVQERYLPDRIRKFKGISYWMQLKEKVIPRLTPKVDVLDLTDVLVSREIHSGTPMFNKKFDVTHWNGAGFYEGLIAMDRHLRKKNPDMPPFPHEKFELIQTQGDPPVLYGKWANDHMVTVSEETIVKRRGNDLTDSRCTAVQGEAGNLVLFSDSSWKVSGGLEPFAPGGHTAFPYQWGRHRHANVYAQTFEELKRIVREERPDVIIEAQTERAMGIPHDLGVPEEFFGAARFARGKPILSLKPGDLRGIAKHHIEPMGSAEDAFEFNATTSDPILILPQAIFKSHVSCMIMIDLDVPAHDKLDIFWSKNQEYHEFDKVSALVEPGRNVIFIPIQMGSDADHYLRIDPGSIPGKYRIRKIEVRWSPAA